MSPRPGLANSLFLVTSSQFSATLSSHKHVDTTCHPAMCLPPHLTTLLDHFPYLHGIPVLWHTVIYLTYLLINIQVVSFFLVLLKN